MIQGIEKIAKILLFSENQIRALQDFRKLVAIIRKVKINEAERQYYIINVKRIINSVLQEFEIMGFPYAHLFAVHSIQLIQEGFSLGAFTR